MARKIASRGRPKGSGLNDAARIAAIADLIAANPGMKPTTAIKSLGISDASIIRRLRDKYNLSASPTEAASPAIPRRPPATVAALRVTSNAVRREAPVNREPRTQGVRKPEQKQSAEPAPDAHPAIQAQSARPDMLSALFAASVSAAQVAIQLQFKTMSLALDGSPLACYVRSQEFMRLVAATLVAEPPASRSSRP